MLNAPSLQDLEALFESLVSAILEGVSIAQLHTSLVEFGADEEEVSEMIDAAVAEAKVRKKKTASHQDEMLRLRNRSALLNKIARKEDSIVALKNNVGKYIHFSDSERFGISYHKGVYPGNPKAVYGFPLTPGRFNVISSGNNMNVDVFEGFGSTKYIYIFDVSGKVLDLDSINLSQEAEKVREWYNKYKQSGKSSYHASVSGPEQYSNSKDGAKFLRWLAAIAEDLFKNKSSGINVILRGIGYDAIETRNSAFDDGMQAQIAVVNPSAVVLIDRVINPMMSKEELKEIEYYNSPKYQEEQRIKRELEKKQREEEERAREERAVKFKEWQREDEELRQEIRKLRQEQKFDEARSLREKFEDKWKDFFNPSSYL